MFNENVTDLLIEKPFSFAEIYPNFLLFDRRQLDDWGPKKPAFMVPAVEDRSQNVDQSVSGVFIVLRQKEMSQYNFALSKLD